MREDDKQDHQLDHHTSQLPRTPHRRRELHDQVHCQQRFQTSSKVPRHFQVHDWHHADSFSDFPDFRNLYDKLPDQEERRQHPDRRALACGTLPGLLAVLAERCPPGHFIHKIQLERIAQKVRPIPSVYNNIQHSCVLRPARAGLDSAAACQVKPTFQDSRDSDPDYRREGRYRSRQQ